MASETVIEHALDEGMRAVISVEGGISRWVAVQ
jgi:hypothetical protein